VATYHVDGTDLDAAYFLIRDSYVTLYWRTGVLDATVRELRDGGYRIVDVDASGWTVATDVRQLGSALGFPDFKGGSLDALHDHLRDVATHDHGTDPEATGTVLVMRGYDHFARHCVSHVVRTSVRHRAPAPAWSTRSASSAPSYSSPLPSAST
jgi:Barstar (barnase inhibitor)